MPEDSWDLLAIAKSPGATRRGSNATGTVRVSRDFLPCQEDVLPFLAPFLSDIQPFPGFRVALHALPSHPRLLATREYGSALTILPLEPPRVYRRDIRGRISYIPLFPSFRIHL